MPTRQKNPAGMARLRDAGTVTAGLHGPLSWRALLRRSFHTALRTPSRMSSRAVSPGSALAALAAAPAVLLAGCATLTESTEQYVMVQTVLDHQQVAGVGCVLANDAGRWFVTSPGRVRIRKSTQPLAVDCRLNDVYVYDQVSPKQNSSRWGNILLTAGTGQFIDRSTGAGFDYPGTLTVLLRRVAPAPPPAVVAAPAPPPPPPKPVEPPQPPGGSDIY